MCIGAVETKLTPCDLNQGIIDPTVTETLEFFSCIFCDSEIL